MATHGITLATDQLRKVRAPGRVTVGLEDSGKRGQGGATNAGGEGLSMCPLSEGPEGDLGAPGPLELDGGIEQQVEAVKGKFDKLSTQ
jgi:hypothetical protein